MNDEAFDLLDTYFVSNQFNIATSAIMNLQKDIMTWLTNGTPGAIIYGRPRIGKTRAILYVSASLREKYGAELPIYVLNATVHKATDKYFYSELLKTVGHPEFNKGTATVLKERLINALTMTACATKSHKIVLFVDEAYNFTEMDYKWLMDVYNNLNIRDIHMSVFLVGSEELKASKNSFILSRQHQIVGRFMVEENSFRGITSSMDIAICLLNFDKPLKYGDKQIILTEMYFPDAYKDGKRLINCADTLMEEFNSTMKEMNISILTDIPMMYFINTVKYCLNIYGIRNKNIYFPDKDAWKDSIAHSGYIAAEKLLYEAPIG